MSLISAEHIVITQYFIDEHPTIITVSRSALVSDGAGGQTRSVPVLLPAQIVRKVGVGQDRNSVSVNGAVVFADATVIALPHSDIIVGDTFTTDLDNSIWEVIALNNDPPWRLEAAVIRRG